MNLLTRLATWGRSRMRATHRPGYWMIAVALVAGCAATGGVSETQSCATVADQENDKAILQLAMPEDLLELGSGGGVYCNDGPQASQIKWLYSPVTNQDQQTFWIVANADLVTEHEVDRFFNGRTGPDLSIELVDTSEFADYYVASTDLDEALAAVRNSTGTLSVADYSALRMSR